VIVGDEDKLRELLEHYHPVESKNNTNSSSTGGDFDIILTFRITCDMVENGIWYIQTGRTLGDGVVEGDAELLAELFRSYHLVDKNDTSVQFTNASLIDKDIEIILGHLVNVAGSLHGSYFVIDGASLNESIPSLSTYLQSNEYIVGIQEVNGAINKSMVVDDDLNLVVLKRENIVVLEFEVGVPVNDVSGIIDLICDVSGITPDSLLVEVESDNNGMVLKCLVYVPNANIGSVIVDAVNNLDKSKCHTVLCRTKNAYITFHTDNELEISSETGLSVGAIIGISIGAVAVAAAVGVIIYCAVHSRNERVRLSSASVTPDMSSLSVTPVSVTPELEVVELQEVEFVVV